MSCIVFAVEDNPDDAIFLTRAFAKTQCDLTVFPDSESAIAALGGSAESLPDLLLVDMKLPGTSGLDLIAAVRSDRRLRTMPVVVVSSSSFGQDISDAYSAGASSYVVKPIEYSELEDLIRTIAKYWVTINARSRTES